MMGQTNPIPGPDLSEPLTFEAKEDNTEVKFLLSSSYDGEDDFVVEASTDGGTTWNTVTATTNGALVATLGAGDKVLLRGENEAYGDYGLYDKLAFFVVSDEYYAYGNIMSLIGGTDFADLREIGPGAFYGFFTGADWDGDTNLLSKEGHPLLLPATTLANSCYHYMFYGCTSLTAAPELPATTLAANCYYQMFDGCTSLTAAPELRATTLANSCYCWMFSGCTSLATAPELPATTLANSCYGYMFYGCTSLATAPELPATTLANSCYGYMFDGCTSLATAPELPATTLADYCYESMFYGCTSLTAAPELRATTLAGYCYRYMFYGCTILASVKCLATSISATNALTNWLGNISSSGTFTKAAGVTWPSGASGIPSGWTVIEV